MALPRSTLGEEMLSILHDPNDITKDITFQLEDGSLKAHKIILVARAPELAKLFEGNADEIPLKTSTNAMKMFLEYLYSDRLLAVEDSDTEKKLFELSDLYKIDRLRELLSRYIGTTGKRYETLSDSLRKVVNKKEYSDFQLNIRDADGNLVDTVYAHRVLLGRSRYFKSLFDSGMKESSEQAVTIHDFETETIIKLLEWFYSDSLEDVSVDTAVELIQAANIYDEDIDLRLMNLCTSLVVKAVDNDTVAYIYQVADLANAQALKQACLEIILHDFAQVSLSESYQALSEEAKQEINRFRKK